MEFYCYPIYGHLQFFLLILCLQESAPKKAVAKSANAEELTTDDLSALREAIDALSQEKGQSFIGEHDVLSDIKQELVDYEEDLSELKDVAESTGRKQLQQTKGAARLFKKVNWFIFNGLLIYTDSI